MANTGNDSFQNQQSRDNFLSADNGRSHAGEFQNRFRGGKCGLRRQAKRDAAFGSGLSASVNHAKALSPLRSASAVQNAGRTDTSALDRGV